MNRKALRDSWTQYAEQHGLIWEPLRPSVAPEPRQAKYGSVKTTHDGIVFDSLKEASYYEQLKLRERAGEVAEIELKPRYPLHIMALWHSGPIQIETIGYYELDFAFLELRTGEYKTVDVKSEATRLKVSYRIKKKIVEVVHGISIDEE